jgi:hypothetical protein
MKERKPFTRLIKDSNYYRNASVTLDEKGDDEDGKYRTLVSFERYTGAEWVDFTEVDNFYCRYNAIERCKDAVKQLSV